MLVHHKDRATTSEEPARPPGGSLFAATGGRRRRLTMSGHRRRDASYPEAAKRRSYVSPSYESEYSARAAWRCRASAKGRNDATAQKNPAEGGAKRFLGCVAPLARCPNSRCAALLPEKPFCRHQIASIWPDSALGPRSLLGPLQAPFQARFGPISTLLDHRGRARLSLSGGPNGAQIPRFGRFRGRRGRPNAFTGRFINPISRT